MTSTTIISSEPFSQPYTIFEPSQSPSPAPATVFSGGIRRWSPVFFPLVPPIDTLFDIATIAFVLCFLFLSLLSLSFILHLRIKSRSSSKLQGFSSHWTARFLMTVLISLWALNEFLRLPIFRKSYIFPLLPPVALPQQTQSCKLHLVLSFGVYEPGFLISLLFLINISIKKKSPGNLWAIGVVAITSLPLVIALVFAVYILPGKFFSLHPLFYRSSVLLLDEVAHRQVVYCTYPLLSVAIFGVFSVVYALVFLLSCWKVVSLAINKRLRARIHTLAMTVIAGLSLQILMLVLSVVWEPKDVWYYVVVFVSFLCVLTFGAVGEAVLVIKPITDTLLVEGGPWEIGSDSSEFDQLV